MNIFQSNSKNKIIKIRLCYMSVSCLYRVYFNQHDIKIYSLGLLNEAAFSVLVYFLETLVGTSGKHSILFSVRRSCRAIRISHIILYSCHPHHPRPNNKTNLMNVKNVVRCQNEFLSFRPLAPSILEKSLTLSITTGTTPFTQ